MTPANELISAAQAGIPRAKDLWTELLRKESTFEVGQAIGWQASELPESFSGPGLALLVQSAGGAVAVFAPLDSSIVSAAADPDLSPIGQMEQVCSKLLPLLLPDKYAGATQGAGRAESLANLVQKAGPGTGTMLLPLTIRCDLDKETLWLLGPIQDPSAIAAELGIAGITAAPSVPLTPEAKLQQLPGYARSLLKIRVPVSVTLGTARQPISRIVSLAPGAIIQLAKSCEDLLTLEIGSRQIALGEAVKVGENFGLRVTSMTPPPERLHAIRTRK